MFRQDSMETLWSALYKLKTCEHTIQIDDIKVTYETGPPKNILKMSIFK